MFDKFFKIFMMVAVATLITTYIGVPAIMYVTVISIAVLSIFYMIESHIELKKDDTDSESIKEDLSL